MEVADTDSNSEDNTSYLLKFETLTGSHPDELPKVAKLDSHSELAAAIKVKCLSFNF